MKYELAKQLKENGFSQEGDETYIVDGALSMGGTFKKTENGMVLVGDYSSSVYCPTLSELIEACGDKELSMSCKTLFSLTQEIGLTDTGWKVWWYAYKNIGGERVGFNGSTPEEAVANLWLELNKK